MRDEKRPPHHYLCWCGTVVSPGSISGATLYETHGERHKCPLPLAAQDAAELIRQRPSVAPVSGKGVRVEWTEEAQDASLSTYLANDIALPHLRVEVDRETLKEALWAYEDGMVDLEDFADRLGIHLSDGGTDD